MMSLLRELENHEEVIDLNETLNFIQQDHVMGKLLRGVKGGADFMKKHPKLSIKSLMQALDGYEKYMNSERYAARLFAKTTSERKFYKSLVDDMVKTGKYRVVKDQNDSGGRMWVLRRLHENSTRFSDKLAELKKNRTPLSPSERKKLRESNCEIFSTSNQERGAIWRSVYDKKPVYVSEDGERYTVSTSIDEAIRHYHQAIQITTQS